tara:strand:- start:18 stop:308 length:291 start_codon:yes stop_codon:yes gene_type:complete
MQISIVDFLIWILAVFGAANGVAVSNLCAPFRELVKDWFFLGKLVFCPMCLGFWFGGLASLLTFSPTGHLLMDCFLGSSTSWIIYIFITPRQFSAG